MNAPVRPPVRNPVVLTDAQFEDMTRKGAFTNVGRVELRGGIVTAMSPVHLNHSSVFLALVLAGHNALAQVAGLKVNPEISVRFGGGFQPTADIVFWSTTETSTAEGPLPADLVKLVIEVADTSLADDLGQKLLDYAQAGLAEYWVADVRAQVIHQCAEPGADGYRRRQVVRFGEPAIALTMPLRLDTSGL